MNHSCSRAWCGTRIRCRLDDRSWEGRSFPHESMDAVDGWVAARLAGGRRARPAVEGAWRDGYGQGRFGMAAAFSKREEVHEAVLVTFGVTRDKTELVSSPYNLGDLLSVTLLKVPSGTSCNLHI